MSSSTSNLDISSKTIPAVGVKIEVSMDDGYNRKSRYQKEMGAVLLEVVGEIATTWFSNDTAAENMLTLSNGPLVIMDCGCSEAGWTKELVKTFISGLTKGSTSRSRNGNKLPLPIHVVLSDMASNDWTTAFNTIQELIDETGYGENLTFSGIGKSFYGRLMPANSVSLVVSSASLFWTSEMPKGTNVWITGEEPDPSLKEQQLELSKRDWMNFLDYRAEEVKSGGYMLISVMVNDNEDDVPFSGMNVFNDVMKDLVKEKKISPDFISKYSISLLYLSTEQRLSVASSRNWSIRQTTTRLISSPYWRQFLEDCDSNLIDAADRYADGMIDFISGFTRPTIKQFLERDLMSKSDIMVDGKFYSNQMRQQVAQLLDEIYGKVKQALAVEPRDWPCRVITLLLQRE